MTPETANAFLDRWAETAGGSATLINQSENHTFRVDAPDGSRFVLRIHRPGYQSAATIDSELAWLTALRADTAIPLPRPLPGNDGQLLQRLVPSGGPARHGVLFAWEQGREPEPAGDLETLFQTLGGYAATLHLHASRYTLPRRFTRQIWSAGAVLDPAGLWSDWRAAPNMQADVASTLARLDAQLRLDLAAYGTSADRFGLIHADMRLGNLLVAEDRVTLIDFDDCGFCWFMYDFAAVISFHEADPRAPQWRAQWLSGYTALRPLSAADVAIIDTMVLLRRMALLAWIGSHRETALAQTHVADFARVTAELALPYLARR
jgi:Ser/Thr protein kinase RdoA (MazF antagonist)